MLTLDLYNTTLLKPAPKDVPYKLYIVSGYASATFARRHMIDLLSLNKNIEVYLIIGMPGAEKDHLAFLSIHKEFKGKFKGYYLLKRPPVHCKIYSWYHNSKPIMGFAGSANYSQYGFFADQQFNQLSDESPIQIKALFDELLLRSIYIPDAKIKLPTGHRPPGLTKSVLPGSVFWEIPDKRVTISFLDTNGVLPKVSGLNWGQRLEKRINKITKKVTYVKREPNQAYLSIKVDATKEGFLPEKAYTFTLITDDGISLDCVVAQDGRKSVQTTYDNSILGRYFRHRLGVPEGTFLTVDHLEKYGRTDFTLEKIDDETFLLDFSVRK